MPTPTYTPLANITLGSDVAGITFSAFSTSLYRDLIIVGNVKGSTTMNMNIRFNSDSGGNYNRVRMQGSGSSSTSDSQSNGTSMSVSNNAQITTSNGYIFQFHALDYGTTDKHKSCLVRADNAATGTEAIAHRWASTSAVTSIYIFGNGGNLATGSTFALYGIAA
jgi:hypothetical protein